MITGGLIPFQTNSRLLASNLTLNEARIILDYTIIQRETIDSERKFPISIKKKKSPFLPLEPFSISIRRLRASL